MTERTEAQAINAMSATLVDKALQDPAFRAAVLADPKGAVEKQLGFDLPTGLTLKVVEATPTEYTIVLPYQPAAAADGELTDDDLEAVAGGAKGKAGPKYNVFFKDANDQGLGIG